MRGVTMVLLAATLALLRGSGRAVTQSAACGVVCRDWLPSWPPDGRAGDDDLDASGPDYIVGGNGADVLDGNGGDDRLLGGRGCDRSRGGTGWDRVYAHDGARDVVARGGRRDGVQADRVNRVARDCEVVERP